MPAGDFRDLLQLTPRGHAAGRVGRGVEHDDARPVRDGATEVVRIELEAVFLAHRDIDRHTLREDDLVAVVGVGRIGEDHFVPRFDEGEEGEDERLHAAACDGDFGGRIVGDAIIVTQILRDGFAEGEDASVGRVVRFAAPQ